jgi:hypothetical protein
MNAVPFFFLSYISIYIFIYSAIVCNEEEQEIVKQNKKEEEC